jgi:excisionase family DNA binding protein
MKVAETVFTTKEAADYLGFAEDTIRRYIYRGLISAKKHGPVYFVTKSECDRYRRSRKNPGRPKASVN